MPLNLNERQVDFDSSTIGFPDIGDCMGLVVQVNGGLFGFHIMPKETNKIGAFLAYFNGHLSTGAMTHLHGCCRWTKRYGATGKRSDWEAWMGAIAQLLDYSGPVSGFDAASGTNLKSGEAVYIEARRLGTAAVKFTKSNKGEIHRAKGNKVVTFTAP